MVHMLRDALVDIAVFAKKDEQTSVFIPSFDRAMNCLKSDTPLDQSFSFRGMEAMLPELRAQRLLAAAESAWVFGAMGSWNDIGFADAAVQKEYDAISDKVYDLVVQSAVTAVNTSFGAKAG